MNKAIVAATLFALSSGTALAQSVDNDRGFFVGGGVGQFNIEIEGADSLDDAVGRLDDDDTAWKAYVGYRFNPYISIEGAYIDFGRPQDDFDLSGSSGDFRAELSGFAPSVIGTYPIGPVELSAKVGYYFYDLDLTADIDDPLSPDFDSDDSGEDFMYGVGIGITVFERLNAKLEYEEIDLPRVDNSNALWLTGTWRF